MTDYAEFTQTFAKATDPQDIFAALARLTDRIVGVKLFTIMIHDPVTREAGRIYSNMPDAYPVSGKKPANETDWSRQVIGEHNTFVANDINAIAEVFYDHELIQSLGCESVINIPVIIGGRVLGTINCLHEAGYYTPERVNAAEALKLPGAACLLFYDNLAANGGI